jgi:hypothetical protein
VLTIANTPSSTGNEHKVEEQPVYTELAIEAYLRRTQGPLSEHREDSIGFVDLHKRCIDTRQHVYISILYHLQVLTSTMTSKTVIVLGVGSGSAFKARVMSDHDSIHRMIKTPP